VPRSPISSTGRLMGATRESRSWNSRKASDCPSASAEALMFDCLKVRRIMVFSTYYWLIYYYFGLLYHVIICRQYNFINQIRSVMYISGAWHNLCS
jgi:hypothetical protein